MDCNVIKRMFVGEVLFIDDEIETEAADAKKIADDLESSGFSVIRKTMMTSKDVEVVCAGHKLSMVICDWKLSKAMGDAAEDLNATNVIALINGILAREFVPVFICSSVDRSEVESYLKDEKGGCRNYKGNDASSIFIVEKSKVTDEKLIEFLENWISLNPSVKLLKEWERSLEVAKNKMFSDLYDASEYWPAILAKTFKDDQEKDIGEAMGDFVTKNLISRITDYTIDVKDECPPESVSQQSIRDVLRGERCSFYANQELDENTSIKTGDILENNGRKYLVIRRQCDLNREGSELYVLAMNSINNPAEAPIKFKDPLTLIISGEEIPLNAALKTNDLNRRINKAFSCTNAFHMGKILERVNQVIIPCICDMEAVEIHLDKLLLIGRENLKDYKRMARLLEPYVSIVTDKFSFYMSSKGSMRTPKELFSQKVVVSDEDGAAQ